MPSLSRRCSDHDCRRPFRVHRYDAALSLSTPAGVIRCPHCGHAIPADANSIFLTHALSASEEAVFLDQEQMELARSKR